MVKREEFEEVGLIAHDVSKLTDREREVLGLLARGYDIKSAALELSISTSAVTDRLRQARRKLGVPSSREAARILIAAQSEGTFDVHRFSGIPKAKIPLQLRLSLIPTKDGTTMTVLIGAAAFISIIAIGHPGSARRVQTDCRALHRPMQRLAFREAAASSTSIQA